MSEVADKTLEQIKAKLIQELNPKKIYLFGSRAAGTAKLDSDYDFVIVVEDSALNMHERNVQAREALWGVRAAVDVFVYTQKEFDALKNEMSSIPETVLFQGQELNLG